MYDIIIIGGGVAGCGAGITLGSSEGTKLGELKTLILDDGRSDLKSAKLYNVPFIKQGTPGVDALARLREDTTSFDSVSFKNENVQQISGDKGDFSVKTELNEYKAKYVILATGAGSLEVKLNGKDIPTLPHELMPKPGKIKVAHKGRQELVDGIYVAGLLSGATTMYATALGSGVEAACAILSDLSGKCAVIHDFQGSRD